MMKVMAVPMGKCQGQASVIWTGLPSGVVPTTAMLIIQTRITARPT